MRTSAQMQLVVWVVVVALLAWREFTRRGQLIEGAMGDRECVRDAAAFEAVFLWRREELDGRPAQSSTPDPPGPTSVSSRTKH